MLSLTLGKTTFNIVLKSVFRYRGAELYTMANLELYLRATRIAKLPPSEWPTGIKLSAPYFRASFS